MVKWQTNQSFVAKIWFERSTSEDPRWRGHIQHIQGSEEIYFQDLNEMSEFMEQVSGIPGMELSVHSDKVVSISKQAAISRNKKNEETDK